MDGPNVGDFCFGGVVSGARLPHFVEVFVGKHLRIALVFQQLGVFEVAVEGDGFGEGQPVDAAEDAATEDVVDQKGSASVP